MKKTLLITVFLSATFYLKAQDKEAVWKRGFEIGLGIGMDYGGIGVRGTFEPIKRLALFGGLGYNLNAMGFNTGAQWMLIQKRHAFFLTAMYGYNTVMIIEDQIQDKATYYGITTGAGFKLRGKKGNYWDFQLLIPFRSSNFDDDHDKLESIGIDVGEPLPIAISVGYHFKIR